MQIQWTNCEEVEREHEENIRQYAHTYHYPYTVCVCKAFWELPKSHRDGILLHEIGHILAGPEGSEAEATAAAEAFFGAEIRYVDSPYGRQLERLENVRGVKIINRRRVVNEGKTLSRVFWEEEQRNPARTFKSAQEAVSVDDTVSYCALYVFSKKWAEYSYVTGYDATEVVYSDCHAETVKYKGKSYQVAVRPYESGVNRVRCIFV